MERPCHVSLSVLDSFSEFNSVWYRISMYLFVTKLKIRRENGKYKHYRLILSLEISLFLFLSLFFMCVDNILFEDSVTKRISVRQVFSFSKHTQTFVYVGETKGLNYVNLTYT
jgi:hypothetical protein